MGDSYYCNINIYAGLLILLSLLFHMVISGCDAKLPTENEVLLGIL